MAGLMARASLIVKAKFSKLLNRAENPTETLDYSYEQMLTQLQNMKRRDVRVPSHLNWSNTEAAIEHCLVATGLRTTLKTTLRGYPGCVHWHLKRDGDERGTLELTLWPAGGEIWFSVQSGRRAPWIREVLIELIPAIEVAFR